LSAGTLARYAEHGDHVVMAHLTDGERGHYEMDPMELAAVRRSEAANAGEHGEGFAQDDDL